MGWKADLRAQQAAESRRQREELRRQKELERREKEQAKLTTLEQARLDVETYENRLAVLLSIHKDQGERWDWQGFASMLPPPRPQRSSYHELRARQQALFQSSGSPEDSAAIIEWARARDEEAFQKALEVHSNDLKLSALARQIIAGDCAAHSEVLAELSPLEEIAELGSAIQFTVHSSDFIECSLKVNGTNAIPSEVKTLTATGKVSAKPMPRARFHEVYQDYICGCVLRVARELFALLPVETVLVTASVETCDHTAMPMRAAASPVLSTAMTRAALTVLDFDAIDPSDTLESFLHRGDFKASRKTGAFQPIVPLTAADVLPQRDQDLSFSELLSRAQHLRDELKAAMEDLGVSPSATISQE